MKKSGKTEKTEYLPLKITVAVLSASVVFLSVLLVVFINKNNDIKALNNGVEGSLSSVCDELSRADSAISEKNSEIESYSQAIDEKDSKIADLNKQVSIKREQQKTAKPVISPTAAPKPVPPPDGSAKTIYLTFDDGPSPNTPKILQILNEKGVKATFFVINTKYNSYMKDIVSNGHAIALHSFSHDYKTVYSSDEAYYNDLQMISDVVYNETGIRSNIIRFPGGSSNAVSRKYSEGIMSRVTVGVGERGYRYFDWNCSSGDASGNNIAKDVIIENCKKLPSSNTVIVLLHDTSAKGTTVEALPEIIDYYKNIGCQFGIIDGSTPVVHHRINN